MRISHERRTLPLRRVGFISLLVAGLLFPALFSGCACFNKDNVPTLNFVQKHLVPESTTAQIAASPVLFPVGLAALGVDIVAVHPIQVIPDVASDTKDALWDEPDWEKAYVTECAALPWRTIFTPVVFGGDFLGRSCFDIPGKAGEIREKAKHAEDLAKVRRLVEEGKYAEAKPILENARQWTLSADDRREMMLLRLKVQCLTGDYGTLWSHELDELMKSDRRQEVLSLLDTAKRSDQPLVRWSAYQGLLMANEKETEKLGNVFRELMAEPDPVFRAMGLRFVDGKPGSGYAALLPELKRVAREDTNPTNRALAARIAEKMDKQTKD